MVQKKGTERSWAALAEAKVPPPHSPWALIYLPEAPAASNSCVPKGKMGQTTWHKHCAWKRDVTRHHPRPQHSHRMWLFLLSEGACNITLPCSDLSPLKEIHSLGVPWGQAQLNPMALPASSQGSHPPGLSPSPHICNQCLNEMLMSKTSNSEG